MPCQDYWSPGIKASVPGRASSRRAEHHQPRRPNWFGGQRGPGRGAGGRRQDQAGLRDRPLRAKLACGDLAGGPPPTGTHSGPAQQNKPRGGRAWLGFEKTRRANHQHTLLHLCGGHRGPGRGAGGTGGPGRASRSTTPSAARVWRSRGRAAAHRHQHAGTNTQPQIHRHNEAARSHRGRAAHASGR